MQRMDEEQFEVESELKNLEAMRREFVTVAYKSVNPDEVANADDDDAAAYAVPVAKKMRKTLRAKRRIFPVLAQSTDDERVSAARREAAAAVAGTFELIKLPDVVLEEVLRYLSFDKIAEMRILCRKMNEVCGRMLNRGFRAVERYHAGCMKVVKSKLPRRESERRNHPLARHCDILTAIETRISLLAMTFMKFVDVKLCCFIPGKVIDEIFVVLRSLRNESQPPRAFEILQELRDISSMAMEHFDEKIVPTLKVNSMLPPGVYNSPKFSSPSACISSITSMLASTSASSRGITHSERLVNLEKTCKYYSKKLKRIQVENKKVINELNLALQDQGVKIAGLEKVITNQQLVITSLTERLTDLEKKSKVVPIGKEKVEENKDSSDEEGTSRRGKKRKHVGDKI